MPKQNFKQPIKRDFSFYLRVICRNVHGICPGRQIFNGDKLSYKALGTLIYQTVILFPTEYKNFLIKPVPNFFFIRNAWTFFPTLRCFHTKTHSQNSQDSLGASVKQDYHYISTLFWEIIIQVFTPFRNHSTPSTLLQRIK